MEGAPVWQKNRSVYEVEKHIEGTDKNCTLAGAFCLALTPNFDTRILDGAFAFKEKFHGETFLFSAKNSVLIAYPPCLFFTHENDKMKSFALYPVYKVY